MVFQNVDAAAAEQREVRASLFESFILVLGVFGLVISLSPLIYVAAVFRLICGFWAAPVKAGWLLLVPIFVGFTTIVIGAGIFGVAVLYRSSDPMVVAREMQADWRLILATAVLFEGIVASLLTVPGILQQLRDARAAGYQTAED